MLRLATQILLMLIIRLIYLYTIMCSWTSPSSIYLPIRIPRRMSSLPHRQSQQAPNIQTTTCPFRLVYDNPLEAPQKKQLIGHLRSQTLTLFPSQNHTSTIIFYAGSHDTSTSLIACHNYWFRWLLCCSWTNAGTWLQIRCCSCNPRTTPPFFFNTFVRASSSYLVGCEESPGATSLPTTLEILKKFYRRWRIEWSGV